ncbi:hypothetical protein DFP91_1524 [Pseudorhodoplanes sinuspersici]|uniref:HNH nuclease domain-containing protein n=2 Tax=Pseudorhodoplanes sinuspersici TaxID=1235591 RepID=A0A1W6ZX27_9HYPH|nr:HNH endonuclease [Pseudorhodoplanes sinuspersici]ARQ01866.1 hypothetical protein CAK95_24300 [Pseudorhodoplanes sinuspersici]RKE73630.1 hypothetical protein DFP91_1524 [Pseudorhodoplanes sinuspersici]
MAVACQFFMALRRNGNHGSGDNQREIQRMTEPKTKGKGATVAYLLANKDFAGDVCLPWPFSKNEYGYGHFGHLGKQHKAHRFMCELVHGPAPSPAHQAAHSCGNGYLGCVNPRHLSWKTATENQLDRAVHGTTKRKGPRATLTDQQVAEIRDLEGKMTNTAIAARYGVHRETVGNILRGISWKGEMINPNRNFDPQIRQQMVRRAKEMRDSGKTLKSIGETLGISRTGAGWFVQEAEGKR